MAFLPDEYNAYPHKRYSDSNMGVAARTAFEQVQLQNAVDCFTGAVRKYDATGIKSALSDDQKQSLLPHLTALAGCGWPMERARDIIRAGDYDTKSLDRADRAFRSIAAFAAGAGIAKAGTLHTALFYIGKTLLHAAEAKYSPTQPRVPRGNSDGGQWTDAGGAPLYIINVIKITK